MKLLVSSSKFKGFKITLGIHMYAVLRQNMWSILCDSMWHLVNGEVWCGNKFKELASSNLLRSLPTMTLVYSLALLLMRRHSMLNSI